MWLISAAKINHPGREGGAGWLRVTLVVIGAASMGWPLYHAAMPLDLRVYLAAIQAWREAEGRDGRVTGAGAGVASDWRPGAPVQPYQ